MFTLDNVSLFIYYILLYIYSLFIIFIIYFGSGNWSTQLNDEYSERKNWLDGSVNGQVLFWIYCCLSFTLNPCFTNYITFGFIVPDLCCCILTRRSLPTFIKIFAPACPISILPVLSFPYSLLQQCTLILLKSSSPWISFWFLLPHWFFSVLYSVVQACSLLSIPWGNGLYS